MKQIWRNFALVCVLAGMGFLSCFETVRAQQSVAPPYEAQLLRLSELMGSIHFLSLLCRPEDGQIWHDKMEAVLEAEGKTKLQRAKLVERFNSGFIAFQSVYRQCSPSATTALEEYLNEGQSIVDVLTTEFSR